mmetsp:Transcript_123940/g.185268  ORF Transcript_123940/g.185268 Transcript_123940/m.185268 type:complete len:146 (+) Transcript_123940:42-479(+)|eukprot:CAMPEP_0117025914 /NCGR_PEP_ID=MMETSP0472-20121206/19098_1 /TAXON_ID=693140 ORGANISM="Tiarina fusus, Strain LIS" /NCGR_SAMPLE_ID=MMETSP0472 /ASSEMBLY_ACC=CAM_ASM_000603 /LENGTH=145 /DNA_ID=CAMNT_0004732767 /DNA_START=31 /DNA_END=468 /DNA_ORIENTATION=-
MAKRLQREFQDISSNPPSWLSTCSLVGDDLQKWRTQITGPEGSPFAGGKFVVSVEFSNDYPFKPPKVQFMTKVYHPNVKSDGQICTLGFPWAPQNKAQDYLLLVRQLLEHPSDEDPLEPAIGSEYKNNRAKYEKKAKEHTAKYAK